MKENKSEARVYSTSKLESDALFNTLQKVDFEANAVNIGIMLKGIWKFSPHSKIDFANLLGIEYSVLDEYFNGERIPSIEVIIRVSKIFNIPVYQFFISNYFGQTAFYDNDLIKFLLLRVTTPKNRILKATFNAEFYYDIFYDFAKNLVKLKEIIESQKYENKLLDKTFLGQLARQYYKLLEQTKKDDSEEFDPHRFHFTDREKILKNWFNVGAEYLGRLIVEGIRQIKINESGSVEIVYSFIEDIQLNHVVALEYDSQNYTMKSN